MTVDKYVRRIQINAHNSEPPFVDDSVPPAVKCPTTDAAVSGLECLTELLP